MLGILGVRIMNKKIEEIYKKTWKRHQSVSKESFFEATVKETIKEILEMIEVQLRGIHQEAGELGFLACDGQCYDYILSAKWEMLSELKDDIKKKYGIDEK